MNPLPSSSPVPRYEDELVPAQRAAVRLAAALAAVLLVVFAGLDRALVPDQWLSLLVVRLGAALVLLACAREAPSPKVPVLLTAAVATATIAGCVEIAIFATGGAHSLYLFSMMAVQAGVSMLVPLLPVQAALLNLEIFAVAMVPIALRGIDGGDRVPLGIAAAYLLTMAVMSVAGAAIQDRVRRREHHSRAELARNFGLLNLGTLAGGLAHELSNPLNALGLQVEMLSRDPAGASRRVEKIRGNVERMRNILEAMRNGARLSAGERREVELGHQLDLAYTLVESKLRNRVGVVRAYNELPLIYCQPTLLGQVLVNLLANAADAIASREAPRLWLRVKREGDTAVVEVEDNGTGVPGELRTKIFEPFFSTKGDKGNGLGLWISSEIARMHGGELSCDSGAQGGAVFRLRLPIDAREAPGDTPQPAAGNAAL